MHALPKEQSLQLAPSMEHKLAQVPLPLGLGQLATCSSHGAQPRSSALSLGLDQLAACSSHGVQPRSSASPTRTRPPCSLLLYWSTASLKYLSHWDSTTRQLHPPKEHNFSQGPLPLGLDHLAACSTNGAQPHSSASPIGTRPPGSCILPRNTASLKGLFHWDSATLQLAPPMEHSLAQVPFSLGLDHLPACSSHDSQLRSRASSTDTRHTMENKARNPYKYPPRTLWDLICLQNLKSNSKYSEPPSPAPLMNEGDPET
ncbi:hypothetical protein Adt_03781 [Abeliophyllum distichum]|uniref:Uncharacterized protein n=1 Tax=Abeliophyllum distichum TaxID=126358 RepID=A0ABD1VZH1_9LAMI